MMAEIESLTTGVSFSLLFDHLTWEMINSCRLFSIVCTCAVQMMIIQNGRWHSKEMMMNNNITFSYIYKRKRTKQISGGKESQTKQGENLYQRDESLLSVCLFVIIIDLMEGALICLYNDSTAQHTPRLQRSINFPRKKTKGVHPPR